MRFRTVFGECAVSEPDPEVGPSVLCTVEDAPVEGLAFIGFEDPEPLDAARFATTLFADRAYRVEAEAGGWSILGSDRDGAASGIAFRGPVAVVPRDSAWQPLIGNLALNRVLRLQRGVVFLHAAAAVVHGRGALFAGPKHSGKTTLSAALAARGHGFLGDELAAVRLASRHMIPFRRALSFREGPAAREVEEALARDPDPHVEMYPDGAPRRRARAGDLFPGATTCGAPLSAVFVLRSFADKPSVERFVPTPADTGLLSPFSSSLWGLPEGLRAMKLATLLAGSDCYYLDAGSPEETAALVENTLEG